MARNALVQQLCNNLILEVVHGDERSVTEFIWLLGLDTVHFASYN